MSENPLYKKAYFQCARRAILENEVLMKKLLNQLHIYYKLPVLMILQYQDLLFQDNLFHRAEELEGKFITGILHHDTSKDEYVENYDKVTGFTLEHGGNCIFTALYSCSLSQKNTCCNNTLTTRA